MGEELASIIRWASVLMYWVVVSVCGDGTFAADGDAMHRMLNVTMTPRRSDTLAASALLQLLVSAFLNA